MSTYSTTSTSTDFTTPVPPDAEAVSPPAKASTTAPKTEKQLAAAAAVNNMPAREFRRWNKLADGMAQFHAKFEWEFNHVYEVSHERAAGKPARACASLAGLNQY